MQGEYITEYEIHRAVPSKHKEPEFAYSAIFKACEKERNVLLHLALNQSIKKLLNLVRQNEAEVNKEKAQIYPIILKENQTSDLPFYIKKLTKRLLKNKIVIKQNFQKQAEDTGEEQQHVEQNDEDEQLTIFGQHFQKVFIKEKEGSDVRDILLDIYADSEEIDGKPDFEYYVYVITKVTDLSEDNLYIFSKGITHKNFIVFLPTYQNFENQNYESALKLQIQKYTTHMYDSKALFSQYIYNCIKNPKIKAYLPPQVLGLITDMDYYHLSFTQSCRRFNYCLLKSLQLNPAERPVISIDKQIHTIQTIIKNKFQYKEYQTNWLNILKVILTEQQIYRISHSTLSVEVSLKNREYLERYPNLKQGYTQEKFIEKISNSFKKLLDKNELAIFEQKEEEVEQGIRSRRKRNRLEELGIPAKDPMTAKQVLENNITRIIKTLTRDVRNHTKSLKWSSFKFNERIKPCIPLKLVEAMKKEEDEMVQLVEDITAYHFKPISNLLAHFDQDSIGYGLYLIKTMQLSGLITLSKKQINPYVYNNFYEKVQFN